MCRSSAKDIDVTLDFLAGIGAGLWKDRGEIEKKIAKGVIFRPKMSAGERASRMEGWRKAVERALL